MATCGNPWRFRFAIAMAVVITLLGILAYNKLITENRNRETNYEEGAHWRAKNVDFSDLKDRYESEVALPQYVPVGFTIALTQIIYVMKSPLDDAIPSRQAIRLVYANQNKKNFSLIQTPHSNGIGAQRNIGLLVGEGYFAKLDEVGTISHYETLESIDFAVISEDLRAEQISAIAGSMALTDGPSATH